MLQKYRDMFDDTRSHGGGNADAMSQFDLRWIFEALLQHRWLIIVLPLVLMALASLYVLGRPATYSASTQLELTNLRLAFSREDAFFVETQPDPAFLETQLQVIRSDRVALRALTDLGVLDKTSTATDRAEALQRFRGRYGVARAGQSNVVQLNYSANDPALAALYANGIAAAYLAELEASRVASAQSGSSWLRERLREVGPKARVIAEALPPPYKSNTRGMYVVFVAGMFGGFMAVLGALGWRFLAGRVRTPEEVAAITGVSCFGQFPRLPAAKLAKSDNGPIWNTFTVYCPQQSYVLEHPGSNAWHAIRNAATASQESLGGKGQRFIGVTSTFAGEGRSTIASNLALSLAASNNRVLLVDADSFDPGLSASYAGSRPGLIDYLNDEHKPLSEYTIVERRTKLHLLPIGGDRTQGASIWTERMRRFTEEADETYDFVIFDLPTLGMNADLRAAARYIEGFLLVIGWQQVSGKNIRIGLDSLEPVNDKLLGAILNNVDMSEARWSLSPQAAFASRQLTLPSPRRAGAILESAKQGTTWSSKMLRVAFPPPPPPPLPLPGAVVEPPAAPKSAPGTVTVLTDARGRTA